MNREVRNKTKAAKDERTEKRCNIIEEEMMAGNSQEAFNILQAVAKTLQHKSAVIEDS